VLFCGSWFWWPFWVATVVNVTVLAALIVIDDKTQLLD
jgi:hypothetical protein